MNNLSLGGLVWFGIGMYLCIFTDDISAGIAAFIMSEIMNMKKNSDQAMEVLVEYAKTQENDEE